eukprot:7853933-Ditylum_brightwellii.AAC.1
MRMNNKYLDFCIPSSHIGKMLRLADLGGNASEGQLHTPHNELEDCIDLLSSKVAALEGSIIHLTDMLGAM